MDAECNVRKVDKLGMENVFTPFGILAGGCGCALALSLLEIVMCLSTYGKLRKPEKQKANNTSGFSSGKKTSAAFLRTNVVRAILSSKELGSDPRKQMLLIQEVVRGNFGLKY